MSYHLKTEFDLSDPGVVAMIDDLPLWAAPFGLKLLEVIELRKNMRVLDIGSGSGFPGIEIAQRLGTSCEVYAVDPWETAVDRARQKIRQWNVTNLHLVDGRAEALAFEDRFFDLIVSNNGTNNVDDEDRVFAELGRVAKPGAQLTLTMNLPGTMREFYDVFEQVLSARGMSAERDGIAAHIFEKRKPISHMRALMARSGFEIVRSDEDAFTLRFVDGTAMLRHSLIRIGFLGSWIAVLQGHDVASVFDEIEAELDRRAGAQGGLTLTIPWVCFDCRRSRGPIARPEPRE